MQGALPLFDNAGFGGIEADLDELEKLKEISIRAYEAASLAAMNSTANINIGIYVRKVLDAAASAEKNGKDAVSAQMASREAADRAAIDRGDPLAAAVLNASYKTGWEIHRVMGFLRFSPVELRSGPALESGGGTGVFYLARCAPDHFVLPAMAEHFARRFGGKPWAIIDEKRGLILIRRPGKTPSLEALDAEDSKILCAIEKSCGGDGIEDLWRLYHKSVLIENRKNLKLQRQFVPLRYRKYLTEFKP